MKPTNIKFQTELYAHKIEVHVQEINFLEATEYVNGDVFDANSLGHIIDQFSSGDKFGNFVGGTHIHLPELNGKETYIMIHGSWRIIPNYRDLHRIMMWNYNRASNQFEYYTVEDFVEAFSYNGAHYFEKYTKTFNHDLWKFIAYLGNNILEGESFLTLTMKKVEAYEKRQADNGYPASY